MSLGKYFTKLPKDAPLPMSWKPSAEPPTKRLKRGPGQPRIIREPQVVTVDSGCESEKENEPDNDNATGSCETAEVQVEKDSVESFFSPTAL